MKKIIILALSVLCVSLASCVKLDYASTYNTPDELFPDDGILDYRLRKVLQIDEFNPNGIDLVEYFDFFSSYELKIYYENAKIAYVELDNGDIPFDYYGYSFPTGKIPCYFDTEVYPNAIRLMTGETVAQYRAGEFYIAFQLGCEEISYKFTFGNKNYEK